eukprot:CAMPEP_0118931118 /NCGR_PEP_ID=MMETSP1169-20130426/7569_1 /TAXON_ID=36882 /ORGANISM="Pyramimonas obovata, Strain CCMP722" /LENGTH=339 /DNA_ID=CAMNT_0006873579 /DNA_START=49 /DNA_END=1064 /DNA_ORIENTATION=-
MYSAERKSQLTMGCEYRARTGACGCPNPPYGCRRQETKPSDTGFKISFPQGVNSYRDLRTGGNTSSKPVRYPSSNKATEETTYNDQGIPIRVTSRAPQTAPAREAAAPAVPAPPAPPPPLPLEFAVPGLEQTLPAVGWQCTAKDAASAVSSGVRYIDANGDPAAESALGAALATLSEAERAAVAVGTTVTAPAPGLLHEHVEAAAARLGVARIHVLCLEWEWDSGDVADNGWDDVGGLETAWGEMAALVESGSVAAVGLQCREAARVRVVLERVLRAGGGPRPAVVRTALHPRVPKVQRLLLGLCRRNNCRVMALEPLGGARAGELKQLEAVRAAGAPA